MAFLATGAISVEEARDAVDVPTLVVLFGMMLLSAQYRLSGLYTVIGERLCFALTPLLLGSLLAAGRPPLPYLLAIACASNSRLPRPGRGGHGAMG